jgi:hypothetical protein
MMRSRGLQATTWVFARFVPAAEREPIVGDLVEEYALRANASSSSAALKWYLQQVCTSAAPLLWARLRGVAWISTIGVALLAYIAVGVAETTVNWAISNRTATGAFAFKPLGLMIVFPMIVLIGYFAARFRRGAPVVLGAMMLLVVTLMTLLTSESMPPWYRVAYFIAGPSAAFIGGSLRSLRLAR